MKKSRPESKPIICPPREALMATRGEVDGRQAPYMLPVLLSPVIVKVEQQLQAVEPYMSLVQLSKLPSVAVKGQVPTLVVAVETAPLEVVKPEVTIPKTQAWLKAPPAGHALFSCEKHVDELTPAMQTPLEQLVFAISTLQLPSWMF